MQAILCGRPLHEIEGKNSESRHLDSYELGVCHRADAVAAKSREFVRSRNRSTNMKQRRPRIELDTPIVPRAIAAAVVEEASVWLGQPLPRRWIRELTARANTVYSCNPGFRRRIATRDNAGRDRLWAFTRHWLSDLIRRDRCHLHDELPNAYSVGHPLPPKPVAPARRQNRTTSRLSRHPGPTVEQSWAAAAHFHFA
jgi:hypothetical protein